VHNVTVPELPIRTAPPQISKNWWVPVSTALFKRSSTTGRIKRFAEWDAIDYVLKPKCGLDKAHWDRDVEHRKWEKAMAGT
jgi:hypothetical protein